MTPPDNSVEARAREVLAQACESGWDGKEVNAGTAGWQIPVADAIRAMLAFAREQSFARVPERDEIADIIDAMVSGPAVQDIDIQQAHRNDQLAAADAIRLRLTFSAEQNTGGMPGREADHVDYGRNAFEAMLSAPYRKEFEGVPWHVLERSITDQRYYQHADTRRRWKDFQAGYAAALAATGGTGAEAMREAAVKVAEEMPLEGVLTPGWLDGASSAAHQIAAAIRVLPISGTGAGKGNLQGSLAGSAWRLVPVEPTEAMIDAYFDRCRDLGFTAHINATAAWSAMLAAAPLPATVNGWRDIASAPKDGTIFLALEVHPNSQFRPDIYEARYREAPLLSCLLSDERDPRCHNLSANKWSKPTHWQPTPALPTTPTGDADRG